jgi:oligosaccharide repeat unit polymerase
MFSKIFKIRSSADLPFYCSPLRLFLAVWLLMLTCFQLRISYTSYPDLSLAFLVFAFSLISFLIGLISIRSAYFAVGYSPMGPSHYKIDIRKLRRFHLATFGIALAIIIMNWKLYGLPPLFGFFGAETLNYQEYGSLRQVLFSSVMALFVSAPLDPSALRRWILYIFGLLVPFGYASRGSLLITLFQALIVFSFRTNLSKKMLYLIAFSTLCFAVILSDVIGNGRSSLPSEAMLHYLRIKTDYYDWPTAYIWLISYISTPISNLCWIIHVYRYDHPSAHFLYSMLPGFSDKILEVGDLGSENIIDGVHTYIAKYYLDLWVFGIFIINYVWGLISGYISAGNRLSRNYLSSAVLLGCIGFMFFSDFLTTLMIILQLSILTLAQRYFTVECASI